MNETIEKAKNEFLMAKGRLCHAFATTPDDRINWSATPTARTPVQLVAHSANSIQHIHNMMVGKPFTVPTSAEAEVGFREIERQYTTREEVLALLEANSNAFVAFLDALNPDQLDNMIELPYKMGQVPLHVSLAFPADHTIWHVAQLDYAQTVYGDLDWHTGF